MPEYEFPIYNPSHSEPGGEPYPTSTVMRYPKPGFPNPKVEIHVFDLFKYSALPAPSSLNDYADTRVAASTYHLQFSSPFAADDTIVTEVTWVGKDDLIIKATNRIASIQRVAHFAIGLLEEEEGDIVFIGDVVREDDFEKIDGGWVEPVGLFLDLPTRLSLIRSCKGPNRGRDRRHGPAALARLGRLGPHPLPPSRLPRHRAQRRRLPANRLL